MRRKRRMLAAAVLALLLLCGAVKAAAATTAASLTADITALGKMLAKKHGVVEHGDYGWLDSTDYDAVYNVYDVYADYRRKNPAGPMPANGAALEQMRVAVDAAAEAISVLLAEIRRLQAGFAQFTEANYSEASVQEAAALRAQVDATPMESQLRKNALVRLGEIDNVVVRTRGYLTSLRRELLAVRENELRFDETEPAELLLERYHACSADARAFMDCSARVQALTARLAVLSQTAREFAALREEIGRAAQLGHTYENRVAIAALAARYSTQELYVREKLEAALGEALRRFLALQAYLEERTRAVLAAGALLQALPEQADVLLLEDAATEACRVQALQALAAYEALLEDAERAELAEQRRRLDGVLLATTAYTVTAQSGPQGKVTVKSPVYYGRACTVRAVPNAGWSVGRVAAGGETLSPADGGWAFTVTRDAQVSVEFVRTRVPVSTEVHCAEGNACNVYGEAVAVGEVEYGSAAGARAVPEDSHAVESMTATMDGAPVPVTLETENGCTLGSVAGVTGGIVFTVVFAPRTFTVTTACLPAGAARPQGTVSAGASVRWGGFYTGVATPEQGFCVKRVLVNGTPVSTEGGRFTVYDIRADVLVEAEFERLPDKGSGGGGSRPEGGSSEEAVRPEPDGEVQKKTAAGYVVALTPPKVAPNTASPTEAGGAEQPRKPAAEVREPAAQPPMPSALPDTAPPAWEQPAASTLPVAPARRTPDVLKLTALLLAPFLLAAASRHQPQAAQKAAAPCPKAGVCHHSRAYEQSLNRL